MFVYSGVHLVFFFFLMIRRPPRSTLFPYHDALPISRWRARSRKSCAPRTRAAGVATRRELDRKSTRLNSSHITISYAVFCLKKKKKQLHHLQFKKKKKKKKKK